MSDARPGGRRRTPARTLVVWCPDWPVTAAGCPPDESLAVTARERVVAASATAQAAGVRPGQRRREAEAYCPDLAVRRSDPAAEARAFEAVVAALETFGVPVTVGEPGWAAIGTRGPARRLGGEVALAHAVAHAVAAVGPYLPGAPPPIPAGPWWRIGVADGPFAATMAASCGGVVVEPGATPSFLAGLDISTLAAAPSSGTLGAATPASASDDLVDLLRRLGIVTLGAFAAVPDSDVLARFGPAGARLHRVAAGAEERPLTGRSIPPDLSAERRLEPPETRVDAAAFVAKEVAERLHEQLAARGLACRVLRVEIATAEGGRLERLWADDGAWSAALVAERLRWQLEAWLVRGLSATSGTGDARGIECVRLVPVEVVPDDGRQLGLWGRPPEGDERAARAFARVQGLLGVHGVLRPVRTGGRGPGEQVGLIPVGDPVPDRTNPAPWPGHLPAPSPAVVPRVAVPAEVLDADGTPVAVDGRGRMTAPPVAVRIAGAPAEPVVAWAGPWPVDERWWDGAAHRRRARIQVLTTGGAAYLVVLEGGRWAVEGSYD